MAVDYVIACDVGTSEMKTSLISTKGLVDEVRRTYPVEYPKPGWSEQDPNLLKEAIYSSIKELVEKNQDKVGFIKGITQLDGRLITINSDNIIKPNTVKSLENEGMYDLDNGYYGNLFLKFKIVYPNSLTNEQIKFIKEYF